MTGSAHGGRLFRNHHISTRRQRETFREEQGPHQLFAAGTRRQPARRLRQRSAQARRLRRTGTRSRSKLRCRQARLRRAADRPASALRQGNAERHRARARRINAEKIKIGGKAVKFELLSEDDQADPKQGAVVAQKLADAKIQGMLGHFNSKPRFLPRGSMPKPASRRSPWPRRRNTPHRASRRPSAP